MNMTPEHRTYRTALTALHIVLTVIASIVFAIVKWQAREDESKKVESLRHELMYVSEGRDTAYQALNSVKDDLRAMRQRERNVQRLLDEQKAKIARLDAQEERDVKLIAALVDALAKDATIDTPHAGRWKVGGLMGTVTRHFDPLSETNARIGPKTIWTIRRLTNGGRYNADPQNLIEAMGNTTAALGELGKNAFGEPPAPKRADPTGKVAEGGAQPERTP